MNKYQDFLDNIENNINEVVEEKVNNKVSNILKDKHTMSQKLYEVMYEIYLSKPFSTRKNEHILKDCKHCRFSENCDREVIPQNVGEPIKSEHDFIPATVCCKEFEWD